MKTTYYEVGDRVRIIRNDGGHCHKIGDTVTITDVYYPCTDYEIYRGDGKAMGLFNRHESQAVERKSSEQQAD